MSEAINVTRAPLVGAGINLLLAAIKIAGVVIGHSNALVADGIESGADVVSSLVVWGGLHIAVRPADDNHPYGHGKAESLAAVAASIAAALKPVTDAHTALQGEFATLHALASS